MFGPSSGVVFELRQIISNQKWANAWLVLLDIGLGQFIIILSCTYLIWRNKQHTSKLQVETHIFSQRERTCGNKRRKMPFYNSKQKMELEHKRSRLRSFVSIIVLKICFSCLHFFTFCYLSWATVCDVAFSDYYESILFHVRSSTFEISTKLAVIVTQ